MKWVFAGLNWGAAKIEALLIDNPGDPGVKATPGAPAAGASTKGGVSLGDSLESILDIVSEATRQVPERDWARLPTGLSKNVDHYLYGTKKKEK